MLVRDGKPKVTWNDDKLQNVHYFTKDVPLRQKEMKQKSPEKVQKKPAPTFSNKNLKFQKFKSTNDLKEKVSLRNKLSDIMTFKTKG